MSGMSRARQLYMADICPKVLSWQRGDRQGLADPAVLLPRPLTLSDCRLISTVFYAKCTLFPVRPIHTLVLITTKSSKLKGGFVICPRSSCRHERMDFVFTPEVNRTERESPLALTESSPVVSCITAISGVVSPAKPLSPPVIVTLSFFLGFPSRKNKAIWTDNSQEMSSAENDTEARACFISSRV